VKLLDGENVPEGFMNCPEFEPVCESLKANRRVKDDVQDIIRFLDNSAWRSSEALNLEWSKVDTTDWVIRLGRRNDKEKKTQDISACRRKIWRRGRDSNPRYPKGKRDFELSNHRKSELNEARKSK